MKNPFVIALTAGLVTAAVIKAAPAFSQPLPAPDTYVSVVRTKDLNLASENGRRVLDRRVAQAAREVCGTASDADLAGKNDARKCRAEAIARATQQGASLAASSQATIAVTATR